jgi:hypothetical protein
MEVLQFLAVNWDVLGLLVTNIAALFVKPPKLNKKPDPEIK